MSLIQRSGTYGTYWGDEQNSSHTLDQAQMQINADYIYAYFTAKGWSVNAIAGILGNMQYESAINPGRWQSNNVGNTSGGYGLVQWTPATKYINWTGIIGDYSTMDNNLDRIIYELNSGTQYYPTPSYPMTFAQFTTSTASPYELACAFAWNYERSAVVISGTPAEQEALRQRRGGAGNNWYFYLTGQIPPIPPTPPTPPDPPTPTPSTGVEKNFNFVLFNRRRRY